MSTEIATLNQLPKAELASSLARAERRLKSVSARKVMEQAEVQEYGGAALAAGAYGYLSGVGVLPESISLGGLGSVPTEYLAVAATAALARMGPRQGRKAAKGAALAMIGIASFRQGYSFGAPSA